MRHSQSQLAAANEQLDDIYLPVMACVEKCLRDYQEVAMAARLNQESATGQLEKSANGLLTSYNALIDNGTSVFLLPQVHEELEHLVRLLVRSRDARTARYAIITRTEGIGIRIVGERSYSSRVALFAYLRTVFQVTILQYGRRLGSGLTTSFAFRVHSAPYDSHAFAQEFKSIVDALRALTSEVGLFSPIQEREGRGSGET
ncbi:MAG: hypothetical protein MPN21_17830 [Thermoanaerobaculia bacterium]|nr:hypothetical protein [Thermoanaerobaculia bacterium]